MLSTLTKRSYSLLAGAVASIGIGLTANPAFAANFTYQDSPSIALDFSEVNVVPDGNVRNITGLKAVNISDRTVEAGYTVPFVWSVLPDGTGISLNWENDLDGWFTEDYDGLGNSLLIQSSLPDRIPLGSIADITGMAALPQTQPCDDNPSCVPLPPFLSAVTQQADDEVPFLNLGSLAAGESVSFDQAFIFTFEDDRAGTLPAIPAIYTVNSLSQDVPEPATTMAMLIVGGTAILLKQKRKDLSA